MGEQVSDSPRSRSAAAPCIRGVDPESGIIYVLNTEADTVTILDGRTMRLVRTLPVGSYPIGIAVDEKEGRAYVVNNRAKTLSIVDEASVAIWKTRRIPPNVSSVALDAQSGLLCLALKSEDRVTPVRVCDL